MRRKTHLLLYVKADENQMKDFNSKESNYSSFFAFNKRNTANWGWKPTEFVNGNWAQKSVSS